MKIALFGGTFDPVHLGHLYVAETVIKQLDIDQVWFVPAGNPPHKEQCMFTFEQRVHLLKKAISNHPSFYVYENDLRENDKSYTIYLINDLKRLYPDYEFSFIIGADNVVCLTTWFEYKSLLELIDFIVIDREITDKHKWEDLDYYNKLKFINIPLINISSSQIRTNLMQNKSINKLIPENIISDIKDFL